MKEAGEESEILYKATPKNKIFQKKCFLSQNNTEKIDFESAPYRFYPKNKTGKGQKWK